MQQAHQIIRKESLGGQLVSHEVGLLPSLEHVSCAFVYLSLGNFQGWKFHHIYG